MTHERAAEAVRVLASLVRTGSSLREALIVWHLDAPRETAHDLSRLARRLRLGQGTTGAVDHLTASWGPALAPLSTAVAIHSHLGGEAATTLDAVAAAIEHREQDARDARAMCAGARLSGRMVAALPLVVAPVVPGGGGALDEPARLVLSVIGIALGVAGLVWIERLLPRAPDADPSAAAAVVIAGAVRGGVSPTSCLGVLAAHPPDGLTRDLALARRLVALGCTWEEALCRSSDRGLVELGHIIRRAGLRGEAVEGRLRAWACGRRAAARSRLESEIRRAPVLMVVPLALCVLPSFGLLAIAPLAGAISGS